MIDINKLEKLKRDIESELEFISEHLDYAKESIRVMDLNLEEKEDYEKLVDNATNVECGISNVKSQTKFTLEKIVELSNMVYEALQEFPKGE